MQAEDRQFVLPDRRAIKEPGMSRHNALASRDTRELPACNRTAANHKPCASAGSDFMSKSGSTPVSAEEILLGHARITSTAIYTHLTTPTRVSLHGLLDRLMTSL